MSLRELAKQLESRGRGGDTTLVHMTQEEVGGLQALAKAHGTSLTVNPDTGLPEAFSLKKLLPSIVGGVVGIATMNPMLGAAAGGALGAATNKDDRLLGGITGALGGFGGAKLGAGLSHAGASAAAQAGTNVTMGGMQGLAQAGQGIPALVNAAGREAFMSGVGGAGGLAMAGYGTMLPSIVRGMGQSVATMGSGDAVTPYHFERGPADFSNDPLASTKEHNYFPGGMRMTALPAMSPQQAAPMMGQLGGLTLEQARVAARQPPRMAGLLNPNPNFRGVPGYNVPTYQGGGMVRGPGDGMSDSIPAVVNGSSPARLTNEEFVIPADVVSGIGNGSSDSGARKLYEMIEKVRQQRTGRAKQPPAIDAGAVMPA